jgi:oligopeptide transport system substrate-binding protein
MKKLVLCLTLGFLAGLNSCGDKDSGAPGGLREAKGGKTYGGTFLMNETGDMRSLDPPQINDATSHHIAENIFDQLLGFDKDLNIVPSLGSLPLVSEDGLTYTFRIRNDVYFHDNPCFPNGKGRKMTAKDVVYSWTRACDPSTNTLALPYFRVIKGAQAYFDSKASLPGGIEGLQAPDDTTFIVTLEKPFSPFINYALVGNAFIYPKEAVDKYGKDFGRNPVGTGPFKFAEYKEALHCLLVRNPNYWGRDEAGNQLPYMDSVKFTFLKENKQELLSFQQNKLHHVYRLPSEFFPDMVDDNKNLKGDWKQYKLDRMPAMGTQFYGMNIQLPNAKNRHLRRAIAQAIDRRKIIKYVLKGQAAEPGEHGIVPPSMPGYNWASVPGFKFNPDSARIELELAKKEMGGTIPTLTLQLNSGGGRNQDVAQAIQAQLKENLGLTVELQLVEWAQHTARIDEGKAEFFRLGWIADYPDPQNFMNLLYGKNIPPSGPSSINQTRYRNDEFDRLYEQAIAAPDRATAMQLWAQADAIQVQDASVIVLFHDEDYHLIQPYVNDFPSNAMDRRPLERVWFSK